MSKRSPRPPLGTPNANPPPKIAVSASSIPICTFPRQSSASSFAKVKFFDGRSQIPRRELRPSLLQKDKLCKRAFPQKKIGESLFTARSNHQIDFRRTAAHDFR